MCVSALFLFTEFTVSTQEPAVRPYLAALRVPAFGSLFLITRQQAYEEGELKLNWTAGVQEWKMEGGGEDLSERISSEQHSIELCVA